MIERLTNDQLDALTTHRLLNLYRKVRQGMFYANYEYDMGDSSEVYEIESAEYEQYLDEMKAILNTREHVENT